MDQAGKSQDYARSMTVESIQGYVPPAANPTFVQYNGARISKSKGGPTILNDLLKILGISVDV